MNHTSKKHFRILSSLPLLSLFIPVTANTTELDTTVQFYATTFENTPRVIDARKKLFKQLPEITACIKNSKKDAPCAYIYSSAEGKEFILELCRDTGKAKKGLYHLSPVKGSKHYSWFDDKFMEQACVENARPDNKAEYWGLRTESSERFDSMIYKFRKNESSGFFYIELNTDGTSNLLDDKKADELR